MAVAQPKTLFHRLPSDILRIIKTYTPAPCDQLLNVVDDRYAYASDDTLKIPYDYEELGDYACKTKDIMLLCNCVVRLVGVRTIDSNHVSVLSKTNNRDVIMWMLDQQRINHITGVHIHAYWPNDIISSCASRIMLFDGQYYNECFELDDVEKVDLCVDDTVPFDLMIAFDKGATKCILMYLKKLYDGIIERGQFGELNITKLNGPFACYSMSHYFASFFHHNSNDARSVLDALIKLCKFDESRILQSEIIMSSSVNAEMFAFIQQTSWDIPVRITRNMSKRLVDNCFWSLDLSHIKNVFSWACITSIDTSISGEYRIFDRGVTETLQLFDLKKRYKVIEILEWLRRDFKIHSMRSENRRHEYNFTRTSSLTLIERDWYNYKKMKTMDPGCRYKMFRILDDKDLAEHDHGLTALQRAIVIRNKLFTLNYDSLRVILNAVTSDGFNFPALFIAAFNERNLLRRMLRYNDLSQNDDRTLNEMVLAEFIATAAMGAFKEEYRRDAINGGELLIFVRG